MNAANLLTLLRIVIVPFFVFFIKFDNNQTCKLIALVLFIVACLTDAIDGKIARKFNLVTNFGKFFDPLADKILVTAAMVCFVELNLMDSTYLIIILFREFLVTSLRISTMLKNKVIAANFLGKIKTVLQTFATLLVLFCYTFCFDGIFNILAYVSIVLATLATVVSGIAYFIQNFKYIS